MTMTNAAQPSSRHTHAHINTPLQEKSGLVRMRTELEKAANRLEQERLAWEKRQVSGLMMWPHGVMQEHRWSGQLLLVAGGVTKGCMNSEADGVPGCVQSVQVAESVSSLHRAGVCCWRCGKYGTPSSNISKPGGGEQHVWDHMCRCF